MRRTVSLFCASIALALALVAAPGCGSSPRSVVAAGQPSAPHGPRFEEIAAAAGIRFQWGTHGKSPLTNLDTFGCGCAFLDVNHDGWLDVLLVGEPVCGLFLNRGDGTFIDIS